MIKKLKAWLVKNHLTEDPSDFVAVVDSNGSIDLEGIVEELIAEGMELKRETAIDVISRFNRKCINLIVRGFRISTGLVHIHITIRGAVFDKKWDPERNKLHFSITPDGALRREAAETSVEILGERGDMISLFNITDLSTGKSDGSIRRGFNAELKGAYIKLAGTDPSVGVYLHGIDTGEEIKLPETSIVINEPSRVLLLIPGEVAVGSYELHVTTQYTVGSHPLKTPRTAVLSTIVSIE